MNRLHTVNVRLAPADGLRILHGIDSRQDESWQLVSKPQPNRGAGSMSLEVWVEGSATEHTIHLYGDGSWSFESAIVLGEAQE